MIWMCLLLFVFFSAHSEYSVFAIGISYGFHLFHILFHCIHVDVNTCIVWPDLNNPIFMLSFIRRSLSLGLVLNLNTLPDEDLYSMSSWESSFMARPIVWLVGIPISGDSRRWHSLLLTSSTQSPPQRNTSDMADMISSHW